MYSLVLSGHQKAVWERCESICHLYPSLAYFIPLVKVEALESSDSSMRDL